MKLRKLNKKGDIGSIMIVMTIVFVMFILGIVALTMWNPIMDELTYSEHFSDNEQALDSFEKVDDAFGLLDLFILLSFFGFIGGLIVSAIYIDVHPVFIVFFILFLIIGVFIASQLSNAIYEMEQEESLQEGFDRLTISGIIFGKYFPLWILIIGAITIVILYGKGEGVA